MNDEKRHALAQALLFKVRLCFALLGTLLLTSGAWSESSEPTPKPPAADNSAIIATVGGAPITAGSLRREMARDGGHDPTRFDEPKEKQAALELVVRAEVLARAAIEAGYDKDPEIQDEIKRLLGQRFWADQQRKQQPERVSEEEVQRYYQSHRAEFEQPVQVRGSIALLRARADASPADLQALRKKAESLAKDVQSKRTTFAELASRYSEDQFSRERGGDIGWVTPGHQIYRWDKQVLSALSEIEKPESTPQIVATDRGIYLVYLTGRRGGDVTPLDSVRKQVSLAILAEKQRTRTEASYSKLRARYPLEVNKQLLQSVAPDEVPIDGPPTFPIGQGTASPTPRNQNNPGGAAR